MMTVTELKRDRMSLEEVYRVLDYTEGMQQRMFRMSQDGNVGFTLDDEAVEQQGGGFEGLPATPHPFLTFHVGTDEYKITNEAVIQAFKLADMPSKLADQVPLRVTEPLLNWQFKNQGSERKALVRDGVVVSFCRPATEVYSTRKLLEAVVSNMFDENVSVVNFSHTIEETHFTVLDESVSERLPDGTLLIAGVQFQSSLVGLKPLHLDAFVLRSTERETGGEREVFEGGALSTSFETHAWDRTNDQKRLSAEPDTAEKIGTAYDFAASAAGLVLGDIAAEFERVAHLSEHTLDQRVGPYLDDVIKKYKLPPRIYLPIMQEFAHSESNRSTLDLWMAFGHVGLTDLELTPRLKKMIFQTAGEIARNPAMCSTCHRSMIRD